MVQKHLISRIFKNNVRILQLKKVILHNFNVWGQINTYVCEQIFFEVYHLERFFDAYFQEYDNTAGGTDISIQKFPFNPEI